MSAQPLEIRMAHLEGAYEQINHRLGNVEDRLGRLEMKVDNLAERVDAKIDGLPARFEGQLDSFRAEMERRFSAVDQKFLWVIGLIVVSILIPLIQRFLGH